jgi:hypothetical protein
MAVIKSGASTDQLTVDATSKAARATLYDAAGNVISSDTIGSTHYLKTSTVQDIHVSTGNSSTANIASGASFAGTSETNLGVAFVQVMLFADMACTVQVQQSIDGSNWDYVDTYKTQASVADARGLPAKGSFVKVTVTNNGAGTTTVFRLQTVLAPVFIAHSNYGAMVVDTPKKPTYRSSFTGAWIATCAMSLRGSSTKLVRPQRIGFSGTAATGAAIDLKIDKLSNLTGGTPASLTMVSLDSREAAATALAQSWSGAAPTPTTVGTIYSKRYEIVTASVTVNPDEMVVNFGDLWGNSPVALRGTAEWITINPSGIGTTPAGDMWVEWTEE